LASGVADHRREIANEENRGVSEVLEVFQLAKDHGVAQMNIRRGWVHAQIDAKRLSGLRRLFELRLQILLANDFGDAFFQVGELFFDGFEFRYRP